MKKTITKRLLAVLMAFVMICSVCNVPDKRTEAASASDKYDKGYDISSLLSQFQFFLSGNVTMGSEGHTVGAVVVGKEMSLDNSFGDAAIVPSYVKDLRKGNLGTGWHGKYPNKSEIVYYSENHSENQNLGNNWIHNPEYINTEEAFKVIQEQSQALASTENSEEITDTNIKCDSGDVYVTLKYEDFKNGVNISVPENVDWFKDHVLCISVTGVNNTDISFDGYSSIKINDTSIDKALEAMSGADEEYHMQLNVDGMNLVWNFPDASGTITAQGVGGHLVAPNATVDFKSGNYEGGVIAANMKGGAQGHFYPMSLRLKGEQEKEEQKPDVTAKATFSKKDATGSEELSGASITLFYMGEGSITAVECTSGQFITKNVKSHTISWQSTETAVALEGLPAGEYMMVETGAPNGYKYAESIEFTIETDGTITQDGKLVTDPITMYDEAKTGKLKLKGTKKVTGVGAPTNETYKFIVKDENDKEVATGTVTGSGDIDFTEIEYGLKDLDQTYTYTIIEEKPENPIPGMKYDEKKVTVKVTIKDIKSKEVDGKTVLIDDLTIDVDGDIVFTNEYVTASGKFSKKAATGDEELPGAELSLSYSGNKDLKDVVAGKGVTIEKSTDNKTITWTSGTEAVELSGLPDGTYVMKETGAPDGYKYASEITFEVKDGKIYQGTTEVSTIEMIDEAKSGKLTLDGTKVVEGTGAPANETYKFVVKDGDTVIANASTTGAGDFTFAPVSDAFTYGPEDIGTHTYTVSEVKPTGENITPGMIYDNTEYTVTVSVKDEGKEKNDLTVSYTVKKGTEEAKAGIVFTNRYYNPASAVFSKKAVAGGDELPGATLTLTYDGKDTLDEVERVSGPEVTKNDTTITWTSGDAPLELSDLPNGNYVMTETGAPAGYKYSSEIYFQVKDSKIYKGTKSGNTITYDKEATAEPIEMIDEAKAGALTLKGTKTVIGKNAPEEEYKFSVKDNKGAEVATGSVTGSGTFKFTDIKYGPQDVGKTYTYTVSEVTPATPTKGMTYDDSVFTVTVEITDDPNAATLVVTSTVSPSDSIAFENVYKEESSSTEEPTTDEPSTTEPTTTEPTTEEPTTQEPTTEQQTVVTPPTGNLEIVVRDEKTKDPVPNATVEIVYPDGHKEEALTDDHGQITKNNTPIGEYTITVTKVPEGYDVSTGQSAKALVETNKTTRHIAEIVTKTTVTTDSTAKTGDSFEVVVPIALLIYSAAAMIILGCGKKKH